MIVATQQEKKEVKKKRGFPKLMKNIQFGFIILATKDGGNNTTGTILSDPSIVEPIYEPGYVSHLFTSDKLEDYNEELILSNK